MSKDDGKDFGVNFRCLGGFSTPHGKTKRDRIYRSAAPGFFTDKDLKHLNEKIQNGRVIDLRGKDEINKGRVAAAPEDGGDLLANGARWTWVDISGPATKAVLEEKLSCVRKFAWFVMYFCCGKVWVMHDAMGLIGLRGQDGGLVALYDILVRRGQKEIGRALKEVAKTAASGQPTLIHCSVGKDRTGILSALLLLNVGASEDEIVRDYVKSGANVVANPHIVECQDPAILRSIPRDVLWESPEHAIRFILAVIKDAGGIHKYLTEQCELTEEELSILRHVLVD